MDRARRLEIEACLRDALERAKAQYECAKREFEHGVELHNDLGATHPDGSLGHATALQNQAFSAYYQALIRFNRFILDGKLPEDQNPARRSLVRSAATRDSY